MEISIYITLYEFLLNDVNVKPDVVYPSGKNWVKVRPIKVTMTKGFLDTQQRIAVNPLQILFPKLLYLKGPYC